MYEELNKLKANNIKTANHITKGTENQHENECRWKGVNKNQDLGFPTTATGGGAKPVFQLLPQAVINADRLLQTLA